MPTPSNAAQAETPSTEGPHAPRSSRARSAALAPSTCAGCSAPNVRATRPTRPMKPSGPTSRGGKKNRRPRDGGKAPILDSAKQEPAEAEAAAADRSRGTAAGRRPGGAGRTRSTAGNSQGPTAKRASASTGRRRASVAVSGRKVLTCCAGNRRPYRHPARRPDRWSRTRIAAAVSVATPAASITRNCRGAQQREIVERRDGTPYRDASATGYGDVIRRSRIEPDGNEIILAYVDEDAFEARSRRVSGAARARPAAAGAVYPGGGIHPRRRAGPERRYLLRLPRPAAGGKVQRYYSVDEVKRSARIRDTVRRVDLDTITFEFGSADIAEEDRPRRSRRRDRLLASNGHRR